mgnify:CR=1 FL=1
MVSPPQALMGSSPLTQGKPGRPRNNRPNAGLIPAHAGKTVLRRVSRPVSAAHPRSRGENTSVRPRSMIALGSSPLTRGKLHLHLRRLHRRRLIPAHAGKTPSCVAFTARLTAHPRSRGENPVSWPTGSTRTGSSPLTRGKRALSCSLARLWRLIPAHAGKTIAVSSPDARSPAHPRSRGENS